jgi:cytochrome c-type biogenesis protein CcmF
MAQLGHGALLLAFAVALFGIALNIIGERRRIPELSISGVRAVVGVTILLGVAATILLVAFATHDFSFAYVSGRSSRDMPMHYVITAFYGGQEGSLLFWALVSSVLASFAFARNRARFPRIVPYAAATYLGLTSFLLYMLCFVASPFEVNAVTPENGQGLNPLLRDPGMLIHPPMLLSGYSSFAVPFSIAIGALLSGRITNEWLRFVRKWTLIAWAILGTGIFLGGWWAYHVLGWGGYWGWDPVENVSLLPWLTATAFIHSIMVQERRGMLKVWNVGLLLASYVLAVFGTFVVRSGLIQSVHSFAISEIGPYFLAYLVAILVLSIGLMVWRLPMLQSENTLDSMLSRESGFLLNNLIFAGIAFATFWGTVYPLISEAFRGEQTVVGPPFYEQVNGPLFLVMLILMGVGPLLGQPWAAAGIAASLFAAAAVAVEYWRGARVRRRNSGESLPVAAYRLTRRDPRRYGGYIVHLGVVVIAIGIIGSTFFQTERQVVLRPGESVRVAEYTLTLDRLVESRSGDAWTTTAVIHVQRGSRGEGTMEAKRHVYDGFPDQPTTEVATTAVGFDDVYVMLREWNTEQATSLHIFINPLVPWIWAGGLVFLLGMVAIFWPAPAPRRVRVIAPARERGVLGEPAG